MSDEGVSVYIDGIADTVVKASYGTLKRIVVTETAAGAITVYDNASAASGTVLALLKASILERTYEFGLHFSKGLVVKTAAASKLTVVYE